MMPPLTDEPDEAEDLDPSVPPDLIELSVELEIAGVTPAEFKRTFGGDSDATS